MISHIHGSRPLSNRPAEHPGWPTSSAGEEAVVRIDRYSLNIFVQPLLSIYFLRSFSNTWEVRFAQGGYQLGFENSIFIECALCCDCMQSFSVVDCVVCLFLQIRLRSLRASILTALVFDGTNSDSALSGSDGEAVDKRSS